MRNLILILGNQLFAPDILKKHGANQKDSVVFMREDPELASYFKFHQQKIAFFFSVMRNFADELSSDGFQVHYEKLGEGQSEFGQSLIRFITKNAIERVCFFEIEDKFFESRILDLLNKSKIAFEVWPSPMFLTSREEFRNYLKTSRRPFMKTFYESQRRRLKILMNGNEPVGGAWSFDEMNRKPLPKNLKTPEIPKVNIDHSGVISLVRKKFADHPGDASGLWLPTTRKGAKDWFRIFLKERLENFGPYEDAIPAHSEFVYHSVLTPFLNTGLLTPAEVVKETLSFAKSHKTPIESVEGFIRQIIGWREFIRGIYQNYDEKQQSANFWGHHKKLSPLWYKGETGVPPLDETLRRAIKRGYVHHIERLMILGNLMLLLEVEPKEAHKWFMEMFIDSSDWVMGPNVYGMGIFSDGGIFATKPYICGSNYLCKMGGYPKGEWCDGVDGLYWQFVRNHKDFFKKNPRLSMMSKSGEKIPMDRWKKISRAADELRKRLVV